MSELQTNNGALLIQMERAKQQRKFSSAHDDQHDDQSLLAAATFILLTVPDEVTEDDISHMAEEAKDCWVGKWGLRVYLKYKNDPVHRLAIAGALIAAEIDRLHRKAKRHE